MVWKVTNRTLVQSHFTPQRGLFFPDVVCELFSKRACEIYLRRICELFHLLRQGTPTLLSSSNSDCKRGLACPTAPIMMQWAQMYSWTHVQMHRHTHTHTNYSWCNASVAPCFASNGTAKSAGGCEGGTFFFFYYRSTHTHAHAHRHTVHTGRCRYTTGEITGFHQPPCGGGTAN